MSFRERVIGMVFAFILGSLGMVLLFVGWKEFGLQEMSGVLAFILGELYAIAALGAFWISLTPVRWHPKVIG
jgi:hypothetical protein